MQTQLTLNLGIEEKVDVRSLIVHGDIERDTPKAKREHPAPEFERVLMDGADCAFRRRCGSRSQMLVLLVTQGQYYVTDERTGSRHALTTARLGTFCKGATGDALTPPWSRQPLQDYDAKGRAALVAMLGCGDFREMCKRDMVRVEAWAASRMGANAKWNLSGSWEQASLVWRLVEPTMGHNHCREALSAALRLTGFYGEGRDEASDAAVARRAEELDGNGFESDGYLIRPAAAVREILDEANAQHNCVAGFIDKYASGQTDLWLMRKTSDPDTPLVTVEVRGGTVRQAFQSHNRQVTAAQRRFLADWCEAVGYNMPSGGRMRALGA